MRDTQGRYPVQSFWRSIFTYPPGREFPWWVALLIALVLVAVSIATAVGITARRQLDAAAETGNASQLKLDILGTEVARQAERERIAREVHDVLGHRLSLLSLHAGALEVSAGSDPRMAQSAALVREGAQQSMADLRSLLNVLRTPDAPDVTRQVRTVADLPTLVTESLDAGNPVLSSIFVDQAATLDPHAHQPQRLPHRAGAAHQRASARAGHTRPAGGPRWSADRRRGRDHQLVPPAPATGSGRRQRPDRYPRTRRAVRRSVPGVHRSAGCLPGGPAAALDVVRRANGRPVGDPCSHLGATRMTARDRPVTYVPPTPDGRHVRVLLVDDDPLVCQGLQMILEVSGDIDVIGVVHDGDQTVAAIQRWTPDLVMLDVRMPRLDGIGACAAIQQLPSPPPVIMLTTFDLDDVVVRSVRAGAAGFLLKTASPTQIVTAVRDVDAGRGALSAASVRAVFGELSAPAAHDREVARTAFAQLTEREAAVARLVARELSNAEIARELYLSDATVKSHLSSAQLKLGVRNRVGVAVLATLAAAR
nr:response regulator [Allobranchiibius huperziae]